MSAIGNLNNMNNNDKLLYYSERITSYEDIRQYIPPISAILFNEFCKVILTNLIKTSHTFNTMIEQARLDEEAKQAAAFGKKEDRVILKDINVTDFSIFDMASEPKKHFWVDLQSFKINGSKKLAIVDANQYDVVKNKLEDVNIQNIDLKKSSYHYSEKLNKCMNRGLLSRILNKQC